MHTLVCLCAVTTTILVRFYTATGLRQLVEYCLSTLLDKYKKSQKIKLNSTISGPLRGVRWFDTDVSG